MAVTPPRFWKENYLFTGATLDPSSETTGNPSEALEDQQRTYYWQTATGWTITDHNNKLDFDLGGAEKTATIVNATYATGASLATAIVTALEAADSAPVWACTYDSGTHKFTINQGSVFTIRWSTGTNAYRSIGRSLGFVVSSNDTGAISYLADAASYQSEHFLVITLTAAQAVTQSNSAAVIGHNDDGSSGGAANIFRLESSATNAWASPTTQANFAGCFADTRKYFTNSSHQFWRLRVDASPITTGYFRLGVLFLGVYVQLPYCVSDNQSRKPGDYTTINTSMGGAHFANFRNRQRRYTYEFAEVDDMTGGNADSLRQHFEALSLGENFILDIDPSDATGTLLFSYGFLPDTEAIAHVPVDYWTFSFQFWEAL